MSPKNKFANQSTTPLAASMSQLRESEKSKLSLSKKINIEIHIAKPNTGGDPDSNPRSSK